MKAATGDDDTMTFAASISIGKAREREPSL
jgi:hypothetical protein